MNNNTVLLFTYGTLKRGFKNHDYADFNKSKFIDVDKIKGKLYGKKGVYPILLEGNDWIAGEIFEVSCDTFLRTVRMELGARYLLKWDYTQKGNPVYYFFMSDKESREHYSGFLKYPIIEWTKELDLV